MSPRPQRLRVLMTSTSYPTSETDWRGVFIRNIAYALARREDIALSLWCPPGQFPEGAEYVASPADASWLAQLSAAGGIAHALRSGGISAVINPLKLVRRLRTLYRKNTDADLVHANWLQLALPLPPDRRPLLVTVLGTDYRLLGLPVMKTLLRRALRGRRAVICPNADWMVAGLEAAFGDVAKVHCVPFGIGSDYYDIQRSPVSPARWLCISRITEPKIGNLFRWGEASFRGQQRQLHLFGPMQETVALPEWVHYHGPATQSELINKWFPSATGLISLSNHPEGRPQVMLEAMAAGLPIVASDLPAHCDLLETNDCGRICRDPASLEGYFAEAESPQAGQAISARAKRKAMELFGTWETCASRYAMHYRDLLGQ